MKRLMEDDMLLAGLFVEGELSNVNLHGSGHVYFTLKDKTAGVSGVLFKSYAENLAFLPENGMKVIVFGRFSLYEKTGQYQLYAEFIEPSGIGSLQLAFEQLKNKLASEGLFDADKKRPLPKYVKSVAVITSPTGAAVQDIIKVIKERNPAVNIMITPALVQGAEAAADIARAIREVNVLGEADVIILGRGGGSMEDLWAFNEEITVRAVAESVIPVISAVGHETDFTITDFAADYRAPTPTAAAAAAVYDWAEMLEKIKNLTKRLKKRVPELVYEYQIHIQMLNKEMNRNTWSRLQKERVALSNACTFLEKNSPYAAWKQGMALVRGVSGKPIASAKGLEKGTKLTLEWPDGMVGAEVL